MRWLEIGSFLPLKLDWIQVEVTTCCNASCVYCPHTVYQDKWDSRHLPLETFKSLAPAFSHTRLVYLQGWGEPLLHPDFFAMAQMAKEAGCLVGTTTNGMALDAEKTERLVESGLDVVAFSLAGADEKNDDWRRGTRFRQVLAAIHRLSQAREKRGQAKPEIHIAYMLLRSRLEDLTKLPAALAGSGVAQVVVSLLDFVASRELSGETLIPANMEEYQEIKAHLAEAAALGRRHGLGLHYHLKGPGQRSQTCSENVQQALVVAADGSVSPCVFANLPVAGVTYFPRGGESLYQRLSFGKVQEQSLRSIWRQKAYSEFRHSFYQGELTIPCQGCLKL